MVKGFAVELGPGAGTGAGFDYLGTETGAVTGFTVMA